MSTPVIINGTTYNIPAYNEVGWAQGSGNLSSFLVVVGTIASARRQDGTVVSSAVPFSSKVNASVSGQAFDITSLSLPAGVWSVSCGIGFFIGIPAATSILCSGGIGTGSGTSTSGLITGDTLLSTLPPVTLSDTSVSIPSVIVSQAVTTVYYLKAILSYVSNTPAAYGRITAIQIG